MNGNIYKLEPSITKEEILQVCKFSDIPNYGDVMSYKEFMECVDSYSLMDYDGSGRIIINDKKISNSSTWLGHKTVYFENKFFVPFDVLYSIFGDELKIIWFNK